MQNVTLVGIDLGKHFFHLHGQDKAGKAVFRKKLSRKQLIEFMATFHSCTVAMEACAGAHEIKSNVVFGKFGLIRRQAVAEPVCCRSPVVRL
jgi:hypothetical protein